MAWSKDEPFGAEFAEIRFDAERLSAAGIAIGSDPLPYRLDYSLTTATGFVTTEVEVSARGDGWHRSLSLSRTPVGEWIVNTRTSGDARLPMPGGDVGPFGNAVDPDLGLSPLFNSLPVLRHNLHKGGSVGELVMVWISVPDLGIHPSLQRYTHLEQLTDGARVRFEAVAQDGEDFVADIVFDRDGLVADYPGIAHRIP